MEKVQLTTKVQMMDTLEKFYIYRETKINNQVNSRMTVKSNIIFDTIVRNNPHRGLPNTYSAYQVDIQLRENRTQSHNNSRTHTTPHSGSSPYLKTKTQCQRYTSSKNQRGSSNSNQPELIAKNRSPLCYT
jgi:hypothetical protein